MSFAPNPKLEPAVRAGTRAVPLSAGHRATLRPLHTPAAQPNSEVLQQKWDDTGCLWRLAIRDRAEVTTRFVISSVGGYVNAKAEVDIDGIGDFEGTILRPTPGMTATTPAASESRWSEPARAVRRSPRHSRRMRRISMSINGLRPGCAQDRLRHPAADAAHTPVARRRGLRQCRGTADDGRLHGGADRPSVLPAARLRTGSPAAVARRLLPGAVPVAAADVVHHPPTRRALVPHYGIMAKRPVISSNFLPALNNPTTNLITTPIARITRSGVRTADGVDHRADLLVLATG